MKTIAHDNSILGAIALGLVSAALIYYFCAALPPGTTLPLSTEVTSTSWSNVEFNEDTSNSAEVMYNLHVGHSVPKLGFAVCGGFVVSVMFLLRGNTKQRTKGADTIPNQQKQAEQGGDGDAEEAI